MMGWDGWLAFWGAALLFAYMPGPALIYAASQTIARGRRAGYFSALGIHLGGTVHVIAAAAGLSALFAHAPVAYLALKIAGAAYLCWLGLTMILRRGDDGEAVPSAPPPRTARRAFAESVAVEVLNPKTALFFVAFLPQFVVADPATGEGVLPAWAQFLILGTLVNLTFSSADLVTVRLADAVVGGLRRSARARRILRAAGGTVLVGLGVRLALDRS